MPALFDRLLRAGEGKILKRLHAVVGQVNAIEDDFVAMSDEDLRAMTPELRRRLDEGESLDDLLPEAFATVREAAQRTLGQRHYDVQLMGGAALHMGNIAEMKTGEGKTLVSTLAAYLNALPGRGVHVVTVNDYLAQRDSEWMGRVHRFLGLSVGVILTSMDSATRGEQYACDITYGTNNEFGFDYLRDNMAGSQDELVQRGHPFAIVDEVDSILIDEARTPLIISGPADQPTRWYAEFARVSQRLQRDRDYEVDEKKRTVGVLETGIERVEDWLGIDNLYESVNTPLVGYLNNAIKAKELFKLDKDYVVMDGEVLIVDEHTGRILAGRRYNEGMHQAIEAKEGVEIKQENQTLATITLQNFFRLYERLSGMTGTAMTEAAEFDKIYRLGVVPIPTNMPMIRVDHPDLVYRTEESKFGAVVADIRQRYDAGQPVLVGTTSVEKSEHLSQLLRKEGVPHEVLNAKYHEREAQIIAQAGRKGAITVATNMAGRGTDIMLGGNPEFMAAAELKQQGLDPVDDAEGYEAAWPPALERATQRVAAEHAEVLELGGLYVVGTERHETRRIDNQLRGRSGRQGDPGESRFYLSLQDDLMRLFKAEWVDMILQALNIPDDVPIENKRVTNSIRGAQTQREAQNFEIRKDVLKYDDVLNRQRQVIYEERRRVLEGADLQEQVRLMVSETVAGYVRGATSDGFPEAWDLEQLWTALGTLYPVSLSIDAVVEESGGDRSGLSAEFLLERLVEDAERAYDAREAALGAEVMRELERRVVLSVLDRRWREHLYEMDYLREGIGLRAMAQRDPLVEYQREGYDLFSAMMEGIKEESVGFLFHLEVQLATEEEAAEADSAADLAPQPAPALDGGHQPAIVARGLVEARRPQRLQYTAPTVDGEGGVQHLAGPADGPVDARPVGTPRTAARAARAAGPATSQAPGQQVTGQQVTGQPVAGQQGTGGATAEAIREVPRNAPCPCGSGKKYKRCHGDPRYRPA